MKVARNGDGSFQIFDDEDARTFRCVSRAGGIVVEVLYGGWWSIEAGPHPNAFRALREFLAFYYH